jgi:transcriptional regulator with XRE-family HTH domain
LQTVFLQIFQIFLYNFCEIEVWCVRERVERRTMAKADVGRNVARLREVRMWTQGVLAREAGVSPTTVSGIESGRISNPHFGTIRKLARVLGVSPAELMAERDGAADARSSLSLEWAMSAREEEFERSLESAPLERLNRLSEELEAEHGRLRALYGEYPRGSEERRSIKRRIRDVSAQSGSVSASIEFHEDA